MEQVGVTVSNRKQWIDSFRGFGMLLVIIGHCGVPDPYWKCIYMFHMPLFFYISGYCYSGKLSKKTIKQFYNDIANKYIYPYLVFSVIGASLTLTFPIIWGGGCICKH